MSECNVCHGYGYLGTGIDEAPSEQCHVCEGSGHYLCHHGFEAESCEVCDDERKQDEADRWAEYHRGVL